MLSRKLLSTLSYLAAQAAAISLETRDAKELGDADVSVAVFDVLRVFYPDCEALKGAAPDKSVTCASSREEA